MALDKNKTRFRNRLKEMGSLFYDGALTSRGYTLTPQRQAFLREINRLVEAGDLQTALARHSEATDFRITGRAESWANCDHVMQGNRLRYLLGSRPERPAVVEAYLADA